MTSQRLCNQCGKESPGHFALTGGEKFPLCLEDISKYITSQGLTSNTILPIIAYDIVSSTMDLELYDEKIEEMDFGRMKVEKLIDAEQDQFEKAIIELGRMKEDMLGTVGSEFDQVIQRLRSFHVNVVAELTTSRQSILTLRREAPLSRVAHEILYGKIPHEPNFYMELITDVVDKLRKTIYSALILDYDNCEDFIMEVLKPDDFVLMGDDPRDKHDEPRPNKIRAISNSSTLTVAPLATSTATPLPPPLPARNKPAADLPPKTCCKCGGECKKQYHQCKESTMCLDCYERLIATECYSKFACCPNCQRLPSELYDFREKKRCCLCKFRLKINEIAHWCQGSENVICDPCYPKIYAGGYCKQCNQAIQAPPR